MNFGLFGSGTIHSNSKAKFNLLESDHTCHNQLHISRINFDPLRVEQDIIVSQLGEIKLFFCQEVKSNSIEVKQNTGSNCPNSVIYMSPIFL